jgi:hypothetical protein
MTIHLPTWAVLGSVAALLIAYDVFAFLHWGPWATISEQTYAAARRWPVLAFTAGVLAGHLFWPQHR